MKIYETEEQSTMPGESIVYDWMARMARMVGGVKFAAGKPRRDRKHYVNVYLDGICAECCVEEDNPEEVTIALAAALARRTRGDDV